jgi:hypothetical protein
MYMRISFQRIVGVSILAILVFAASCNAIKKLGQFYIDYNSQFTIAAGLPLNLPITIASPDVVTNADETFEINDTRKDLVQTIKLKQLTLTITAPQGQTFSFVKNVTVYISADGQPQVEIAHKDSIPANVGTQLDLDLYDVELQNYIKADKFKLTVTTTTTQVLTSDVSINVYSKFFVQANLLKAL